MLITDKKFNHGCINDSSHLRKNKAEYVFRDHIGFNRFEDEF